MNPLITSWFTKARHREVASDRSGLLRGTTGDDFV